jgi:hypothetical protein
MLTTDLGELLELKLALALIPARRALGVGRPELTQLMDEILRDLRKDIDAHLSDYEIRRLR